MKDEKQLKQFIRDIKADLLHEIVEDLRDKKMTLGEAKYLAKDFLALLPAKSKSDLLNKLYSLTKIYPEVRTVFAKYIGPYEEEQTHAKLAILREYMQRHDYDHAYEAMRGGNYLWIQ